jgi:hypothetical protein
LEDIIAMAIILLEETLAHFTFRHLQEKLKYFF